jgi:uncharacterized protein YndB with AHSA1/START domain
MEGKFEVKLKVQKPIEEVFDAVYDPQKLSGYFPNGGADGPLEQGTTVEWRFADDPGEDAITAPVRVLELIPNRQIVLEWQGAPEHNTVVEMSFEKTGDQETLVKISESGWEEKDLQHSYGNCFGWSFMITALKAFVEHGINLREGAFAGTYDKSKKAQG